jgi:hypothetical protein
MGVLLNWLKVVSLEQLFLFKTVSDEYGARLNVVTAEPGYNDIGLYDTSRIASDILWYQ